MTPPARRFSVFHVVTVSLSLRFLRGQAAYMRESGGEIAVACSPDAALFEFARTEGVAAHPVAMARAITPLRDLVAVYTLVRRLLRIRPDIVHAHTPKGGLLGMLSAFIARVPIRIYHLRGLPYTTASGPRRQLLMTTERIACALAHRVICVSESLRRDAIRDGIVAPNRITVLAGGSGNGVDARGRYDPDRRGNDRAAVRHALGIPMDAAVIGFVGRIVRDKGVHELTDAWRRLREEFEDAHLVVVGPREIRDGVADEVYDALAGDRRAHLVGEVDDAAAYYAAFDVVALPTYREGFPNVLLEAGSMALPVVATRVPGCVDAVVEAVTGLLVPPGDAAALAGALRSYLADPPMRAMHGDAARRHVVQHFSREAVWQALRAEYGRLLTSSS